MYRIVRITVTVCSFK